MEIVSLGHAGFRLRGKEVTVVIDPPASSKGYNALKGVNADIICVTHDHPGHNNIQGIGGTPYVVRGPGEYEIGGVLISGIRTFHDTKKGEERGNNTIYLIHMEDLFICHLGDLGHTLTADQQEAANGADILMIPVGGGTTIDAKTAVEVIGELEPSIILPMHYRSGDLPRGGQPMDPVDTFCLAMGVAVAEPVAKLTVTRSSVPAEPQVVILTPKG